ncbi:MAG: TolC family protein [Candidatus Krumholzibacteriia bacterium]
MRITRQCSGRQCGRPGRQRHALAGMTAVLAVFIAAAPAAAQPDPAEADRSSLPVLTLSECVRIALRDSPRLLTAQAEQEVAEEDVKAAWGQFLPDLTLSHTYSKSDRTDFDVDQFGIRRFEVEAVTGEILPFSMQFPTGEVADEKIESSYRDVALSARMNVFEGFGKYSRLGSARSMREAAENNRGWTTELVVQNVAMAYFSLLLYEKLRDVAEETRDQAEQELQRTETYFRLGSAAKSAVLQQRVRLEQTRLDLVIAENQVEQSFANLAYAMNQPLARRFGVDRSVLATDFAVEPLETLYAEALENRLDIERSEHVLEARRGDVTTATSGLWPRLDLFLDYTRYNNESPFKFGAQQSENWRYGYQVSWNFFDRFSTVAGRGRAKAQARMAEYALDQARLDAQLEVRQLYNTMVEAREKAKVSRETIAQAQEELRLASERFRVGAGTALDQITAQVNLASARAEEVRAVVEYLAAEVQLERAVGRFSAFSGPER